MWLLSCSLGCGSAPSRPADTTVPSGAPLVADVVSVAVRGSEGAYTFDVGVRSPDIDCTRFADWWEVVRPDGSLVYRRILNHSHPDEQPFVRDGGPIPASATEELIVRAHLDPTGYGGAVFRGNAVDGFLAATLDAGFATDLQAADPLPTECWF